MATGTLTLLDVPRDRKAALEELQAVAALLAGGNEVMAELRFAKTYMVPAYLVSIDRIVATKIEEIKSSMPIEDLVLDDDLLELQLEGRAAKYQENLRNAVSAQQREYWSMRLKGVLDAK